jgi:hypothetical protein
MVNKSTHAGDPLLLSASPCAQFLAVFTATGKVFVVSMNLSEVISEFDTRSRSPPSQMAWCGADAVVLYWPEILLMVGPNGDWMKYSYGKIISVTRPSTMH